MYYIKHNNEKINLYGDEIYGTCPICGREIQVDFNDIVIDNEIDLYSDTFCDSCTARGYTAKYVEAVNNDTWNVDNTLCLVEDEKVRRHLIKDGFRVYVYPATGELLINDDNGTEGSLALYIALLRYNDRI